MIKSKDRGSQHIPIIPTPIIPTPIVRIWIRDNNVWLPNIISRWIISPTTYSISLWLCGVNGCNDGCTDGCIDGVDLCGAGGLVLHDDA